MTLFSDDYKTALQRMHAEQKFGKSGGKWWMEVGHLIQSKQIATWLDYGCGGGHLVKNIRKLHLKRPLFISEYDPAIPGKDIKPTGRWDLVTCIDVLEHVEQPSLADVLADLNRLTAGILFAVISTRPAGKDLHDGRNAHLIVQTENWWREQIDGPGRFHVDRGWSVRPDEWCAILRSKRGTQ